MKYIISYDISKSKIRKELKDYLISNGFFKIQKSVYFGEIDTAVLLKKIDYLNSFLNEKTDTLIICPLCINDFEKSYFLGQSFDLSTLENAEDFILF